MSIRGGPQLAVPQNLVLCLDAADPASYPGAGTTWYDLSFRNVGAVPSGAGGFPNFNTSGLGPKFTFDGATQYLYAYQTAAPLVSRTMLAWCRLTSLSPGGAAGGGSVVNVGTDGNQAGNFDAMDYGEYTGKRWCNGSNGFVRTPNTVTYTDETSTGYLHIALVNAPSDYRVYRNGQLLVSTTGYSPTVGTYTGVSTVGQRHLLANFSGATDGFWKGDIAVVHVYSGTMTQAQVQQNFDTMRSRFGL